MATRTLKLIQGGKSETAAVEDSGPIARLGVREKFQPLSKKRLAWLFLPKFLLLAMVIYLLVSR